MEDPPRPKKLQLKSVKAEVAAADDASEVKKMRRRIHLADEAAVERHLGLRIL